MLHTINPKYPIYDKYIGNVLGLGDVNDKKNDKKKDKKIKSACEIYDKLRKEYKGLKYLVKIFDKMFPGEKMSDTKKIDTILFWKGSVE